MKKIFAFIIFVVFAWCLICVVKPYWDKYWLGLELKSIAAYATKNTVEDTRKMLTRRMHEAGRNFSDKDFYIEKDKNNTATVGITYIDEISVFGVTLKQIEFTVEESSREASGFR